LISLLPWIYAAGLLHLLIASVNFFAARRFRYGENLARVTPVVRQVFIVQNAYIVLVLAAFSTLCFGFAAELAGGSSLGRYLSGFLAVFWGLRVLVQLFFYDARLKREHRLANLVLLVAYGYLAGVFALAAAAQGS
jgi:alginate O-acetyltransferase complex protein AlgI